VPAVEFVNTLKVVSTDCVEMLSEKAVDNILVAVAKSVTTLIVGSSCVVGGWADVVSSTIDMSLNDVVTIVTVSVDCFKAKDVAS